MGMGPERGGAASRVREDRSALKDLHMSVGVMKD
jgi:hypothetical protein